MLPCCNANDFGHYLFIEIKMAAITAALKTQNQRIKVQQVKQRHKF
ncbi:hypothetical protein yaldo0001_38240 [Yersinia aldovae ATCC 35236]|nr:hypothetical protein yaldo0001_38240 [Yersinia aldovae ATCC 35236]